MTAATAPAREVVVAAPIERLEVVALRIPTERPESDGTLAWDSTTMVLVEAEGGGTHGIGYTYAHRAAAELVRGVLSDAVIGNDALAVPGSWAAMLRAVRNIGRPGLAAAAISAVDAALWDLKARLLGVPLVGLLGQVRARVPAYASGGFTSYSADELRRQMRGWAEAGFRLAKMKVGRDPDADAERVATARSSLGDDVELLVDANGAYDRKQALWFADRFAEYGVTWFEEPVSSDDLEGLRLLRDRAPAGMAVAAGEYGYDTFYFRRMLEVGAVDCLQADATRCLGPSGFIATAALCSAWGIPLSAHTAPALHLHLGCALEPVKHLEYFHDHVRIEQTVFDGVVEPANGTLAPDLERAGLGLTRRRQLPSEVEVVG